MDTSKVRIIKNSSGYNHIYNGSLMGEGWYENYIKEMFHAVYCIKFMISKNKEVFSKHYFNEDGKEIGYIIVNNELYKMCGLFIFDEPREWNEKIGEMDCYSDKIYF